MKTTERLYTRTFLFLCLSHMSFAGSFSMIIPELPQHLTNMGGEAYKGLIISLFTLMAGLSRPFSGKLTDKVGRIPVMVFGTLVCIVCSAIYPLLLAVVPFLLMRFFHGFSTGFKPTASTAYIADIVPADRRGEAMGISGISMNLGASAFPPIGSYLANTHGINVMFFFSSGLAVFSLVLLFNLKETLATREKFNWSHLKIGRNDIYDKTALAPAFVVLCIYMCFGIMLTIIPDQSVFLGLKNKGLFMTSFTACSILSRFVAGRASDKFGRVAVLKVSIVLVIISLVMVGYADTGRMLLISCGFLGFATGVASPVVFAWTIDRSPSATIGRSMATIYIALEISIGSGALLAAALYQNDPNKFSYAFLLAAVMGVLAIVYLQFGKRWWTIKRYVSTAP